MLQRGGFKPTGIATALVATWGRPEHGLFPVQGLATRGVRRWAPQGFGPNGIKMSYA
jgi:hypothetical protein